MNSVQQNPPWEDNSNTDSWETVTFMESFNVS